MTSYLRTTTVQAFAVGLTLGAAGVTAAFIIATATPQDCTVPAGIVYATVTHE